MEQPNLSKEEVLSILEGEFGFIPNWGKLVITLNQETEEGELDLNNQFMSDTQYVLASGERVFADPGDKVLLNMEKLTMRIPADHDASQTVTQLRVESVPVDGHIYGLIDSSIIAGKYTGVEKGKLDLDA